MNKQEKSIKRLFIAILEYVNRWTNNARVNEIRNKIRPDDFFLVYQTGEDKLPSEDYIALFTELQENGSCILTDVTELPDADIYEHIKNQIKIYSGKNTRVYFLQPDVLYRTMKNELRNDSVYYSETIYTGRVDREIDKEKKLEQNNKPNKSQNNNNTQRNKTNNSHNNKNRQEQNKKETYSSDKTKSDKKILAEDLSTDTNIESVEDITSQGDINIDQIGLGVIGSFAQWQGQKENKTSQEAKDKEKVSIPETTTESEQNNTAEPKPNDAIDPYMRTLQHNPDFYQESSKSKEDRERESIHKQVFTQSISKEKQVTTRSRFENLKAEMTCAYQDKLIHNIGKLVPELKKAEFSFDEYMEFVIAILKSENYQDFVAGWGEINEKRFQFNEKLYIAILNEARQFDLLCKALYNDQYDYIMDIPDNKPKTDPQKK